MILSSKIRDSSGMILGHVERMFNELLPHIPAFQVSILSRRNNIRILSILQRNNKRRRDHPVDDSMLY